MDPELSAEKQIRVEELAVYGTGVMEYFEQDFSDILQQTISSQQRWVVVFSPTGCEAMLRALDMLDPVTGKVKKEQSSKKGSTHIATIGPTTRDYLKTNFEYDPDVCAVTPSPQGVEDGIKAFTGAIY